MTVSTDGKVDIAPFSYEIHSTTALNGIIAVVPDGCGLPDTTTLDNMKDVIENAVELSNKGNATEMKMVKIS